jgi:hypothetical protein
MTLFRKQARHPTKRIWRIAPVTMYLSSVELPGSNFWARGTPKFSQLGFLQ